MNDISKEQNKVKDVIYVNDIRESLNEGYDNGFTHGETTHYKDLDYYFTWLPKDVTLIAGLGNHGKSSLLIQLILMKAKFDNWKCAIFTPEQSPPEYFFNDLIHTLSGQSADKSFHNRINKKEYNILLDFLHEHFYYIYPENDSPTPDLINQRFEDAIVKHGVNMCVVDPFNQLVNDWDSSGRDDKYISAFLQKNKRFANLHDIHYIIVAHPKGTVSIDEHGNFRMPHLFDIAGGAMWSNHCDNIVFVHRPYFLTDPQNTTVVWNSAKIKKIRQVGYRGEISLNFDFKSNRFYIENQCPLGNRDGEVPF